MGRLESSKNLTEKRVIPIALVDSTAVVSLYEAHQKVYPRSVKGRFDRWGWILVWITQLLFYGLPWVSWNERQAVLFDLASRRFYIFNLVLYPQDFIYLTGLLVLSALSLFLFTAVAGRLWCGFACPQTVYSKIFMWIEYRIEGDRVSRMRLDQGPLDINKLLRKGSKHTLWIAISVWTGFTFVGYFTPIKMLTTEVLALGLGPWELFWILFYGFATYGNAGWMREQVCKYMCPYARFQSAMFDRDTLIVSYDEQRGETRGSRARKLTRSEYVAQGLGDCIDCGLCVQVCPTNIDIRKGLQYECISCGACIDVCDSIMDKMNYPQGLIRFSTLSGMTQKMSRARMFKRTLRPRIVVYSAILAMLCLGLVISLNIRKPFRVDVVRDRSSLARIVEQGKIENTYRLQIMNATEHVQRYKVDVTGVADVALDSEHTVEVDAAQSRWVGVRVRISPNLLSSGSYPIHFLITALGEKPQQISEKAAFLVPR